MRCGRTIAAAFCGKLPPDINIMIEGNNARICDACIERCHKILEEERGPSQLDPRL